MGLSRFRSQWRTLLLTHGKQMACWKVEAPLPCLSYGQTVLLPPPLLIVGTEVYIANRDMMEQWNVKRRKFVQVTNYTPTIGNRDSLDEAQM